MLKQVIAIAKKLLTLPDYAKLESKFNHLDQRLDDINLDVVRIETSISSLNELNLANNETLETKLNATRAGQESIKELMSLRFMQLEELIKYKLCDR